MCGRYELKNNEELKKIMSSIKDMTFVYEDSKEIFPGDKVPIICLDKELKRSTFIMKWGYTINDKLIFNSRSEEINKKKSFKDDYQRHRCIVPATSYFEWDKNKVKYQMSLSNGLLYMAGIYRIENGIPVFSILTREPSESLSKIHHRMPVILSKDLIDEWINYNNDPGLLLLQATTELNIKNQ